MNKTLLCAIATLTAFCAVAANKIGWIESGSDFETRTKTLLGDGVDYDAYVFRVEGDSDKEAFSRAVSLIRNAQPDRSVIAIHPRGDSEWAKLLNRLVVTSYGEDPDKEKDFIDFIISVKWGIDRGHPKYIALSDGLRRRTQRLHDSKWGVFNHFLGHDCKSAAEWNARVDGFDVKALGERLTECGAKFYFITVMQGRRWMLAPNVNYDRICETFPGEACAKRDLIAEIADELEKRGIDLYLYYTGDGPYIDPELGPKMGLVEPRIGGVDRPFVEKWASVLEEYAVRYGAKVKGWWVDGCYKDFLKYNDDLLDIYTQAIHKGNPDAVIAYNDGVREYYTAYGRTADFTAGEFNDFYAVPHGRFVDGQQAFALIPIAAWSQNGQNPGWGGKGMKITGERLAQYVRTVNERGGVIAIDVRINPDSSWEPDQFEALKGLK